MDYRSHKYYKSAMGLVVPCRTGGRWGKKPPEEAAARCGVGRTFTESEVNLRC